MTHTSSLAPDCRRQKVECALHSVMPLSSSSPCLSSWTSSGGLFQEVSRASPCNPLFQETLSRSLGFSQRRGLSLHGSSVTSKNKLERGKIQVTKKWTASLPFHMPFCLPPSVLGMCLVLRKIWIYYFAIADECFIYQRNPELPFNQHASVTHVGQHLGHRNTICFPQHRNLLEKMWGGKPKFRLIRSDFW